MKIPKQQALLDEVVRLVWARCEGDAATGLAVLGAALSVFASHLELSPELTAEWVHGAMRAQALIPTTTIERPND